jgi:hypothetical protein
VKKLIQLCIVTIIFLAAQNASAYIDLNMFYFGDTFDSNADAKSTTMFIEGSIGFAVDKKQNYLIGWNYSMMNVSRTTTTTAKYASTQMGPRFIWRIGKSKNWSLGLGYYLLTDATDDGTGAEVEWEGTTMKIDFGYAFEVGDALHLGLRGNYSASTYKEQLTAAGAYSEINFKRTHMYPSVYLLWVW